MSPFGDFDSQSCRLNQYARRLDPGETWGVINRLHHHHHHLLLLTTHTYTHHHHHHHTTTPPPPPGIGPNTLVFSVRGCELFGCAACFSGYPFVRSPACRPVSVHVRSGGAMRAPGTGVKGVTVLSAVFVAPCS